MKVVIVGGGKVGYYLVKTLLEHGHDPTLIEIDKRLARFIANDLDIPVISGDGTSLDVLENAGISGCDALICVTGKDQDNLVACQIAKNILHIKRTVAKVNNPKNASIMRQLGIDIAVSSTDAIARLLEREVDTSRIKQLISLNQGQSSISEINVPEHYRYHGKILAELKLPEQMIIVSITRNGEVIIPRGNTPIYSGDKILIMSQNTALHSINEALKLDT